MIPPLKSLFFSILIVAVTIFTFVPHRADAQLKKAERLMKEGRYGDAIRPLRKEFNSKKQNPKAGVMLTECHYKLQEYQEALDVATIVGMDSPQSPDEARLFADVRIANDDFSGAYLGLIEYMSSGGADGSIYFWLDKASYLLSWDTLGSKSSFQEISGINSIYNEYAPFVSGSDIFFVSDQLTVQVLFPTAFTNQSLHLLYKSTPKRSGSLSMGRPNMLMKNREYYFHDGPMAYWEEKGMYALSLREIEGILNELKVGIYFADLSGSEDDLIPFKYNQGYNTGHPSYTPDGTRMYFASDRPGGFGEMDIWYSDWIDNEWKVPVNAGPNINTPGNEVFPSCEGTRLFYSSDRRDRGYGGLDLYYVSLLNDNPSPYNLRAPINSAHDDFAITFRDGQNGFFSSNRIGGQGGDDIYALEFIPQQEPLDSIRMAIEGTTDQNLTFRIYDKQGAEVKGVDIDRYGVATVSGLQTREVYTLKADGIFDEENILVVYNDQGQPVRRFKPTEDAFTFELLDAEKYTLGKEENVDNSQLFDLFGEVKPEESTSFDSVSVVLKDVNGESLEEVPTDVNGKFEFKGLTVGEDYGLETKGVSGAHGIDILGKSGVPQESLDATSYSNSFAYTRAIPQSAWMLDAEIKVPIVYGMVPARDVPESSLVELYAFNDSLIRTCPVDEDGFIELGAMVTGHPYELRFPQEQFEKTDRLVILGGSGDTTQTVRPHSPTSYLFEYVNYGVAVDEEPEEIASILPIQPKKKEEFVYRGKIKGWKSESLTSFLLTDDSATAFDSVLVRSNGSFTIKVREKGNYDFRPVDQDLALADYSLSVYDASGALVSQALFDGDGFPINLLEDEEYAMAKQNASDPSTLLAFDGSFDDWQYQGTALYIIESTDGTAIDTVEVGTEGNFDLSNLSPGTYSFYPADPRYTSEAGLEMVSKSGEQKLISDPDNNGKYRFELLSDEDYLLAKQKNSDSGLGLFSFGGSIEGLNNTQAIPLILTSVDSGKRDTVIISKGGVLSLNPSTPGSYTLEATDKSLDLTNNKLILNTESGVAAVDVLPDEDSVYRFQLLSDEEYLLAKQENADTGMGAFSFGGSIEGMENAESLILTSLTTGKSETIVTDGDGAFSLESKSSGEYKLEAQNKGLDLTNNKLVINTESGLKAVTTYPDENSVYRFELLSDEEYLLAKQENIDSGMGAFSFDGSIEGINKAETLLLTYVETGRTEKVVTGNDGAFSLESQKPGKYTLRPMDEQVDLRNKKLLISTGSGLTAVSSYPGNDNVYRFELLSDEEYRLSAEENVDDSVLFTDLKGKTNNENPGERVYLYTSDGELLAESFTLTGGEFAFAEIPLDSSYVIMVQGATKLEVNSSKLGYKVQGELADGKLEVDFTDLGGKERIISLPDIYYGFDSYALSDASKKNLRKLIIFLRDNPNMKIRILSHTDSRGPSSYNLYLSQKRAEGVVSYLSSQGIDKSRLDSEGRGEKDPINKCRDGVRCTNAEHAVNRRTEFAILSE